MSAPPKTYTALRAPGAAAAAAAAAAPAKQLACEATSLPRASWMTESSPARSFLEASMLVVLLLVIVIEIRGVVTDGPTISGISRIWNAKTGGLLALTIAAVYIHIFLPLPRFWTDPRAARDYNCTGATP